MCFVLFFKFWLCMSLSSSDFEDDEAHTRRPWKGYGLYEFLSKYRSPLTCMPGNERYLMHRANMVCEVFVFLLGLVVDPKHWSQTTSQSRMVMALITHRSQITVLQDLVPKT